MGFALIGCIFDGGLDMSRTTVSGEAATFLVTKCHFKGEADLSELSGRHIGLQNCQFDLDLTLHNGACAFLWIHECDFRGAVRTEDLEVPHGVVAGCSFNLQPIHHPRILIIVDRPHDPDAFVHSVAAHFGVAPNLER